MTSGRVCRSCLLRSNVRDWRPAHFSTTLMLVRSPRIDLRLQQMRDASSFRPSNPHITRIARVIGNAVKSNIETYAAYGSTLSLFAECKVAGDYAIPQRTSKAAKNSKVPTTKDGEEVGVGKGWWYEKTGLLPTFNTSAQITFLHMYILTTKIRTFPEAIAPIWHQHFLNHYFYHAEEVMTVRHQVTMRSVRNKYLKDLFLQWRGLVLSYDEGLIKGDAVLAAAIWRNLFKGDENVDFVVLAKIVQWVRQCERDVQDMSKEVLMSPFWRFTAPGESTRYGLAEKTEVMQKHIGPQKSQQDVKLNISNSKN